MQVIFVDYIDGAGGEFLSHVLSQHRDFYQPVVDILPTSRTDHRDKISSYLLRSRYHNLLDWPSKAKYHMMRLKDLLAARSEQRIAIPYHSCYHDHNDLLREVFPGCQIVYVDPGSHHRLIALEILRKVHLIKLDLQQIKHVHNNIIKINQSIRVNLTDFWNLDIMLLRRSIRPDNQSRRDMIHQILSTRFQTNQTYDYHLPWQNFFLDLDCMPSCYGKLCQFLNIVPDDDILSKSLARNQHNLQQLISFDIDRFIQQNFDLQSPVDN